MKMKGRELKVFTAIVFLCLPLFITGCNESKDKPQAETFYAEGSISVVFDGFHDEDIDLSKSIDVITINTDQRIDITINGDYKTYHWFVNEEYLSEEKENNFLRYGWDFRQVGLYTITVAVITYDDVAYSKNVTFRVVM